MTQDPPGSGPHVQGHAPRVTRTLPRSTKQTYLKAARGDNQAKQAAKRDIAIRISNTRAEVDAGIRDRSRYAHVDLAEVENHLQLRCDKEIDNGFGHILSEACKDEWEGSEYKRLEHKLFVVFWDRVRYLPRRESRHDTSAQRHTRAAASSAVDDIQYKERLRSAINDLPDDLRSAIMLRYFSHMSVSAIAQTVRVSTREVQARLTHARKILHARLRQQ